MWYAVLSEFPILAIAALGFFVSFRFLRFPDLSVDAAYMFGMSSTGMLIQWTGGNDLTALLLAPVCGVAVGVTSGLLHTSRYLGLNKFLAGMLVSFGAYSICFRMCNSAELSLFQYKDTMLTGVVFATHSRWLEIGALGLITLGIWCACYRLLATPFGLALRTVGERPDILAVAGFRPDFFLIAGLALANSLVAVSGWLEVVVNRNVSLRNFGLVVNVLAAVLIGDFVRRAAGVLNKRWKAPSERLWALLLAPIVGSLVYSLIKSFVIRVLSGQLTLLLSTDLQFITAACVVLFALLGRIRSLGRDAPREVTS